LSDNFTSIISTYAQPIATVLGALLVVIITPIVGILVYFKQKEYETIKQRYLDDGLALIIRQVESSLDIYQYNWVRSINLLKTYRDLGVNTPPDLYTTAFMSINNPISVEASRHSLLGELVGEKVYFTVHQFLVVFLHTANHLISVDLCSAIRISLGGGKGTIASPEKIFDTFLKELQKTQDESQLYFKYLGNLKILESLFSKTRLSYKNINKIRNKQEVVKAVNDIKVIFKEQLAKSSIQ